MLCRIEEYLQSTFQWAREAIPECWVLNSYTADQFIRWHTDADDLFGALNQETEIVSFSLGPDGVFCIKPRTGKSLATLAGALGVTGKWQDDQISERGLRHSVKLSDGDLLLMGGWFQREFEHKTVPATQWSTTWATAARLCTRVPTDTSPRVNITGRYIVNHTCPLRRPRSLLAPRTSTEETSASVPTDEEKDEKVQLLEAEVSRLRATTKDLRIRIEALEKDLEETREDKERFEVNSCQCFIRLRQCFIEVVDLTSLTPFRAKDAQSILEEMGEWI